MISKLSVLILVVTVIGLDAVCPENANNQKIDQTGAIGTTTIPLEPPTTTVPPFHPCPRSMHTYLTLFFGLKPKRCLAGYKSNQCATNADCSGQSNNYCCQQPNGCNKCVVPCPKVPVDIPTGCSSGYSAYNAPEGCVRYVCTENLANKRDDDDYKAAIKFVERGGEFLYTTTPHLFA